MNTSYASGFQSIKDLTARETEVLNSLLRALCDKEIARSLDISNRTVRFHVGNIFRKFNVATRSELLVACFHQRAVA
jgi:DNA-binding NarL/FixJ family response regulator